MNFKQNIEKNRLKIKELLERKIGEKKSKIGSSLPFTLNNKAKPEQIQCRADIGKSFNNY